MLQYTKIDRPPEPAIGVGKQWREPWRHNVEQAERWAQFSGQNPLGPGQEIDLQMHQIGASVSLGWSF